MLFTVFRPFGEACVDFVEDFSFLARVVALEVAQVVKRVVGASALVVDVAQENKSLGEPVIVRCVA